MAKRIRKKFDGLFKDKINWRIINMIIDKSMKYEDMELSVVMNVFISKDGDFNIHSQIPVYTCRFDDLDAEGIWREQDRMPDEVALDNLDRYGWFISILIVDRDNLSVKHSKEMSELRSSLEATGKLSHLGENWIGADVYWINR